MCMSCIQIGRIKCGSVYILYNISSYIYDSCDSMRIWPKYEHMSLRLSTGKVKTKKQRKWLYSSFLKSPGQFFLCFCSHSCVVMRSRFIISLRAVELSRSNARTLPAPQGDTRYIPTQIFVFFLQVQTVCEHKYD